MIVDLYIATALLGGIFYKRVSALILGGVFLEVFSHQFFGLAFGTWTLGVCVGWFLLSIFDSSSWVSTFLVFMISSVCIVGGLSIMWGVSADLSWWSIGIRAGILWVRLSLSSIFVVVTLMGLRYSTSVLSYAIMEKKI